MALAVAYHIKIGSQTASSNARENDRLLLSLIAELNMDGVGGRCSVELGGTQYKTPPPGDAVSVGLDGGDGMVAVFTGEVEAVQVGATSQRIYASDGLVKLGRLDVEAAYEDVNVDFIVKDLLQQAEVDAGKVEKGPKLASYVLHRGPRALRHIQHLAEICGADFYSDGEGKAHFTVPAKGGADHSFLYGENILSLDLQHPPPVHDSVEVWGEGAASSKGADKFYWLATDLSGVSDKAAVDDDGKVSTGKPGKRPLHITHGAVRSGETAQALAKAHMAALSARWVRGRLKVFARPGVEPGNLVEIKDLPEDHAAAGALKDNRLLRVRRVSHQLDRNQGFVTRMDF